MPTAANPSDAYDLLFTHPPDPGEAGDEADAHQAVDDNDAPTPLQTTDRPPRAGAHAPPRARGGTFEPTTPTPEAEPTPEPTPTPRPNGPGPRSRTEAEQETTRTPETPGEPGEERPLGVGTERENPAETGTDGAEEADFGGGKNCYRTPRADGEPRGYIPAKRTVLKPVADGLHRWLDEASRAAGVALTDDDRRLCLHVVSCGVRVREADGWVPIHCRLRERELPDCDPEVVAALLEVHEYDRALGLSREYRAPEAVRRLYAQTAASALPSSPKADLFSRKRVRSVEKTTTRCPETGEQYHPAMIQAMNQIPHGLFHGPAIDRHVRDAELAAELARHAACVASGYETLDQARAALRAWQEAAEAAEKAGREAPPRPMSYDAEAAVREAVRLLGRFVVDAEVRQRLYAQVTESLSDGVYRYRQAYAPQSTGRMTDVGGLLQSATREMKRAAWATLAEVFNYDLKSSQPRLLLRQFEGAGVPTANLTRLLFADKHEHARACGITVDAWKRGLMAVVMGGTLFASARAGHTAWGAPRGKVVEHVTEGAFENPAEAYDAFAKRVRPLYGDLQAWRRWLVNVWLPTNAVFGDGGKRYVANAAGARLCVSDLDANERPRKLAAHVLQGEEAQFIRVVTELQHEHGYTVIANEHDGVVTVGEIPEAAVEEARRRTGMHDAELVEKPFV